LLDEVAGVVGVPRVEDAGAVPLLGPLKIIHEPLRGLANQLAVLLSMLVRNRAPGVVDRDLYVVAIIGHCYALGLPFDANLLPAGFSPPAATLRRLAGVIPTSEQSALSAPSPAAVSSIPTFAF